jgi:hypothetical protein
MLLYQLFDVQKYPVFIHEKRVLGNDEGYEIALTICFQLLLP